VRIVIADDHPLFLIGLQHALEAAGATVVAAAKDGHAAVRACREQRPDAVVLDVRMPRGDGVEACRAVIASGSCSLVLLLTTWLDAHVVEAARLAGARGFVSKEEDAAALIGHLERLIADPSLELFPAVGAPVLTDREFQVLDGLARGLTRKAIAARLGLSPETVKDYIAALFAKLDAHDRVTVVTHAVHLGVMPLPPVGGGDADKH
jgi:two-component system, NarL family, nitrate/nitrite response regulator NarL